MKCKHIHIIDYLEGNLNELNREQVRKHLADCPDCLARLNSLKAINDFVLEEKKTEVNPFLITRINQHLDNAEIEKPLSVGIRPAFISLFSVLVIVFGIGFGIWFGSETANVEAQSTYAEIEMQSYFYDLGQEPIESSFLIESYEESNN